jgi:hypothetical protein
MAKLLIQNHTILGPVVPCVRMTKGTRWTPRSQNYLGYQAMLADNLVAAYPGLVLPPCPPSCTKRDNPAQFQARKDWEAKHREAVYVLVVSANVHNPNSDASNVLKTIEDALQRSGIIHNDCKIKLPIACISNDKDDTEWICIESLFRCDAGHVDLAASRINHTLASFYEDYCDE